MLHYPSHEWYRNLAAAMRQRCAEFGVGFVARNAEDEVAEQLRGIRRVIGAAAAAQVRPRETLLVDGGECSRYFAEALKTAGREATVVTNALAILEALASTPGVKVLLTAGEYQPGTRSLVGPSVGALLDTIRVDKAFVSPDGVSPSFGLSSKTSAPPSFAAASARWRARSSSLPITAWSAWNRTCRPSGPSNSTRSSPIGDALLPSL